MRNVGIVFYRKNPAIYREVEKLVSYLKGMNICSYVEKDASNLVNCDGIPITGDQWLESDISFMVSIGGDGTLLHTSRLISGKDIPVLAVNYGYLGFLTYYNDLETIKAIEDVLEGRVKYDKRMKLFAEVKRNGKKIWEATALNDVVLSNYSAARIVRISLMIDGDAISTFLADGIIIATPTGSTAYSLSCNGPIVHPTMNCILVNPVCSHTLTTRPLVIPSVCRLTLHSETPDQTLLLTSDGQYATSDIAQDDTIEITKSEHVLTLIKNPNLNFYEILRSKLGWGGGK